MRHTIYATAATAATTITMTDADLDDIRDAFNKIDVDGSGTITKEELYNRFLGEDSKFNVSKKDFDVLFDIIDKDVRIVYRCALRFNTPLCHRSIYMIIICEVEAPGRRF